MSAAAFVSCTVIPEIDRHRQACSNSRKRVGFDEPQGDTAMGQFSVVMSMSIAVSTGLHSKYPALRMSEPSLLSMLAAVLP